jgi:hypothetical protein
MNFHIYFEKLTGCIFKKKTKHIDISKIENVKRHLGFDSRTLVRLRTGVIGRKYLPNSQSELDEIYQRVEFFFTNLKHTTDNSAVQYDFISFTYKSWIFSRKKNYFIDLLNVKQELRSLNISNLLEDNS